MGQYQVTCITIRRVSFVLSAPELTGLPASSAIACFSSLSPHTHLAACTSTSQHLSFRSAVTVPSPSTTHPSSSTMATQEEDPFQGEEEDDTLIMAPLLVEKLQVSARYSLCSGSITLSAHYVHGRLSSACAELTSRKPASARQTQKSFEKLATTPSKLLHSRQRSSFAPSRASARPRRTKF